MKVDGLTKEQHDELMSYVAHKRLHVWLNNLEHGVVNYL